MSNTLRAKELHGKFINSINDSIVDYTSIDQKPLELDLRPPLPFRIRLYMYNTTHPPGGRTVGEHKIQLIVPGQSRDQRASFDYSGGRTVILCGLQPELEVYILWDASLYHNFPFSRNVQVKAETIYQAFAGNIGIQYRSLRVTSLGTVKETVLTAPKSLLKDALIERVRTTINRIIFD